MQINVTVELASDEALTLTPDAAAAAVLAAVGKQTDFCTVTPTWLSGYGRAGTPPEPPAEALGVSL